MERDPGKPFYMNLAFHSPHSPNEARPDLHDKYNDGYLGMIEGLDQAIGRIIEYVENPDGLEATSDSIAHHTMIVFTSDNGTTYLKGQVDYSFFNSVGPLRGLKGSLYEGGIRVPLITRWPGHIPAGAISDLPVANYDIPATLADIAGTTFDEGTDGISILPTLLGHPGKQKRHDYLFWDFAGYGGQIAVRMGTWKGIKRNLRKNPDAPLELYNLDDDISEKNNVVATYPDIAKKIEKIMAGERTVPAIKTFRFGTYHNNSG